MEVVMTTSYIPSARAQAITRRTYNRPLPDGRYETWQETIDRAVQHQRWLWERAIGGKLSLRQEEELEELRQLMLNRSSLLAGRTLWLGGTEIVKRREASMFNCSFLELRTVHDIVDAFWLLLQGCGVGFKPTTGSLSGFVRKMEIEVVRSKKGLDDPKGINNNVETFDSDQKIWTIRVGDSAEAWAKAVGKILAGKYPAKKIILDFSEIRARGSVLNGYGWICDGDHNVSQAFVEICKIMNTFAGRLLNKFALWDIVNWLGTALSSRRSAEIGLIDYHDPEFEAIATRKYKGFDMTDHWYRSQSNNSILFYERPSKKQIKSLFDMIVANGGSEPGFVNVAAARKRAPWFRGLNPCAEILLANYGFCNLVETDLAKFRDKSPAELYRAIYVIARANYRQTCVNLRDGILQSAWHETNEYLRLCGVGITGIVRRSDLTSFDFRMLRRAATFGAVSMADELGLEIPKNITTIKPSGTLSKIMDTTEGCHRPLGRYIFNNVVFSRQNPALPKLVDAGYQIKPHPMSENSVLVVFPEQYPDVQFTKVGSHYVNREPAVAQLDRYKTLMREYCDQNVSITVSYDVDEVKDIVNWIDKNWDDDFVATSFLFRADPFKTAEDLGYSYLPQQVVTSEEFFAYAKNLKPVNFEEIENAEEELSSECTAGACPIR